jgi:replicative DNA helicase
MIITLNTRSEFIPGTLIADKHKGVYGVVLSLYEAGDPIRTYKVKSLNLSRNKLIRKLQLLIIKKAFKY